MNKREQGVEYLKGVLNLLARVGYASTRQVAKGVWGRCDISTRKMAGRTLRRLLDGGLIVSKRDTDSIIKVNNELLFALTAAGVKEVRRHGTPMVAEKVHGRDYLRKAPSHRTACNSVFVCWPLNRIWSELEVRAGDAPFSTFTYRYENSTLDKIPDLVAVTPDDRYEWIEVENSWRSDKDLRKVVACIRQMFSKDYNISCVHFIVTESVARTIGERINAMMSHDNFSSYLASGELDKRILGHHIKVSMLDTETLNLTPIDWCQR